MRGSQLSPGTQPQKGGQGGDSAPADAYAHAPAAPSLLRLPAGTLERIVGLADADARRVLRATSPALRRLVCGAARELTLSAWYGDGGDATVAAVTRHVAARAPLWHRVQSLMAHQCEAEGLLALLEAAARCACPRLFPAVHAHASSEDTALLAAASRPICHCLTSLHALSRCALPRTKPGTGLRSNASS